MAHYTGQQCRAMHNAGVIHMPGRAGPWACSTPRSARDRHGAMPWARCNPDALRPLLEATCWRSREAQPMLSSYPQRYTSRTTQAQASHTHRLDRHGIKLESHKSPCAPVQIWSARTLMLISGCANLGLGRPKFLQHRNRLSQVATLINALLGHRV